MPTSATPVSSGKFQIRSAAAADAAALQDIYALCIGNADWLPVAARRHTDFAAVSVDEIVHVATDAQGEVLGFVSLQAANAYLHHLYIHPAARGQGLGKMLLAALEKWLPTPWRLKCVHANRQALNFYLKLGWHEVDSGASAHGEYLLLEWAGE